MVYDAFFSYQRKDTVHAKLIRDFLVALRLKIWFDREDIKPGDRFVQEITQGIQNSKNFIFTIKDIPTDFQEHEIYQAVQRKIHDKDRYKIIPILLPGIAPEVKLNISDYLGGFNDIQWVDLSHDINDHNKIREIFDEISNIKGSVLYKYETGNPPDVCPGGYRADVDKVIHLLIGKSLYSNEDVFLREMVQNSVDACERRKALESETNYSIIVRVDTNKNYVEVDDNGEGMNSHLLLSSFAVVGKSIKDEQFNLDSPQNTDLIAKFGIGFISTYIVSDRIQVSTQYKNRSQINFEIKSISLPFEYSKKSKCNRKTGRIGTTVRVYLKNPISNKGYINRLKYYCRHVPYINVIIDNKRKNIQSDWNVSGSLTHEETVPGKYQIKIAPVQRGEVNRRDGFIASNSGFFICENPKAILPRLFPTFISGEINFVPGTVDLDMSRESIIKNTKSFRIKQEINTILGKLLVELANNYINNNTIDSSDALELRNLLMACVSGIDDTLNKKYLPVDPQNAKDILMDLWHIEFNETSTSIRDILDSTQNGDNLKLYYYNEDDHEHLDLEQKQFLKFLKATLESSGHIVVFEKDLDFQNLSRTDYIRTELRQVLNTVFSTENIEVIPLESSTEWDIKNRRNFSNLDPTLKHIINNINRNLKGKRVIALDLSEDAPALIKRKSRDYINTNNEAFAEFNKNANKLMPDFIHAYTLGMLQVNVVEYLKKSKNYSLKNSFFTNNNEPIESKIDLDNLTTKYKELFGTSVLYYTDKQNISPTKIEGGKIFLNLANPKVKNINELVDWIETEKMFFYILGFLRTDIKTIYRVLYNTK